MQSFKYIIKEEKKIGRRGKGKKGLKRKRKKGAVIKSDFDASFCIIGLKGGNLSPSVLTESEQGDA